MTEEWYGYTQWFNEYHEWVEENDGLYLLPPRHYWFVSINDLTFTWFDSAKKLIKLPRKRFVLYEDGRIKIYPLLMSDSGVYTGFLDGKKNGRRFVLKKRIHVHVWRRIRLPDGDCPNGFVKVTNKTQKKIKKTSFKLELSEKRDQQYKELNALHSLFTRYF